MTNKELAERELAERIVQECHRIEHGDSKESKFTYSSDIIRKQNEAVQSIISEYQGEAVAVVSRFNVDAMQIVCDIIDEHYEPKKDQPVYLSAPLKKENDNGR